jgi:CheY-like chemotaxis protein
MKILMIDDNELHLKMGKVLLENLGHEVELINSLDNLRKASGSLSNVDIAFIDYRLAPGETGIEALDYLKSRNGSNTKYIALTADVSEKTLLENSGFDSVVFKPITENLLREIIIKNA